MAEMCSRLLSYVQLSPRTFVRGDNCNSETLNEIKQMPRIKFKNLIKIRIERNALEYLQNKRGSKGKEIEFTLLSMSEYLLPYNSIMSIEENREMFAIRNPD